MRGSSAGGGRRGPIRAVQARLFRQLPRADEAAWAAADGWDSTTVAPRPPITVSQLLLRARVGDSAAAGPSRQRQRNPPHSMRWIRAVAADPPVAVNKNEEKGVVWAHLAICLRLALPSPPPLHLEPASKSERRKKKESESAP